MNRKLPFTGLVTGLALLFIAAWSIAAVGVLQAIPGHPATSAAPVDTPVFAAEVEAGVRSADASKGQALYAQYGCVSCHGTENGVAPYVGGTGQRAATRRSPAYSAAAYLYESITSPNAYVVSGYPANVMPQDFKSRIPQDQLYDLIAWLLTQ